MKRKFLKSYTNDSVQGWKWNQSLDLPFSILNEALFWSCYLHKVNSMFSTESFYQFDVHWFVTVVGKNAQMSLTPVKKKYQHIFKTSILSLLYNLPKIWAIILGHDTTLFKPVPSCFKCLRACKFNCAKMQDNSWNSISSALLKSKIRRLLPLGNLLINNTNISFE